MPASSGVTEREGRSVRRAGRAAASVLGPLLLVGAGSVGTRHLANLRSLGCDDVLLYRSRRGPGRLAPSETTVVDLAAALERAPRAALICNPTALHLPVALAAARAGCHLFVEKPLSHSMDGVAELAAEVAARGLRVLVGYQFRFHPGLQQVKAWLEDDAIGEVASARARWGEYLPGWHPGEDYRTGYSARRDLGGGVVVTLSHPFDYLRWLLGEVVEVQAQIAQRSGLDLDVEDTAHVLLRFASGALATVSLDYVERPAAHRLHLVGRKGLISWDGITGQALLRDAGSGRVVRADPPPGFDRNGMFLAEMRHFLDCVYRQATPACGLDEGIAVLRIALAAKRSALEGQTIRV
jgi:predicted dehydrogenase